MYSRCGVPRGKEFISTDPSHPLEDLVVTMKREPVSKLTFDSMGDFKFRAAYEAYSKAWDGLHRVEERQRLNNLISRLSKEEISYSHFYREVNQYLRDPGRQEFRRVRIHGERKRDYRRKEQRRSRQKRHKR